MKTLSANFSRKGTAFWYLAGTVLSMGLGLSQVGTGYAADPVNPLTREHTITIDPTALNPPTWWQVPGVTPLIYLKDPTTYDSFKTTEAREINLKPGEYQFGTFTFNFMFRVNLDGQLEFDESLSLCVDGRGSNKLVIKCSHTQPYKQDPDYDYPIKG
jgi:hypothetical protein